MTNRLMIFKEIINMCWENHKKNCVGKIKKFVISKRVVHILTTVIYRGK
jgi:hypothetical protein